MNATHSNRTSGLTPVDTIAGLAVLIVLTALVVPALSQAREDARITKCADNLHQLAAANLKYAAEFEGRYFYDWGKPLDTQLEKQPKWRARWWDAARIGQYIEGKPLQWNAGVFGIPAGMDYEAASAAYINRPMENNAGLGGGVFVCPAGVDHARSYHQNHWASGIDTPPRPRGLDEDEYDQWQLGQFFTANDAVPHDRLMLFGEMLPLYRVRHEQGQEKGEWATGGAFGDRHPPSVRFSGALFYHEWYLEPTAALRKYPSQIDYARHTDDPVVVTPIGTFPRPATQGRINIAYADGHVAANKHTDLYNPERHQSTYQTLWSPVDQKVARAYQLRYSQSGKEMPWQFDAR